MVLHYRDLKLISKVRRKYNKSENLNMILEAQFLCYGGFLRLTVFYRQISKNEIHFQVYLKKNIFTTSRYFLDMIFFVPIITINFFYMCSI